MNLIQQIAKNCDWLKTVNDKYRDQCEDKFYLLEEQLPHGSGIDSGCKIDREKSSSDKVIITFGFHHMNDGGYYDGWTEHKLIITPKLCYDFDLRITGRNRNQIKDYLYDTFDYALKEEVEL